MLNSASNPQVEFGISGVTVALVEAGATRLGCLAIHSNRNLFRQIQGKHLLLFLLRGNQAILTIFKTEYPYNTGHFWIFKGYGEFKSWIANS